MTLPANLWPPMWLMSPTRAVRASSAPSPALHGPLDGRGVRLDHDGPVEHADAEAWQNRLELGAQHRAHNAAAAVAAAVAAHEHHDVGYVAHAPEQVLVGLLAHEPVAVYWRQAVVGAVQRPREQVALGQRLHALERHARQEGHVLERRQQVG